jgi:hypothetical protein
MTGGTHTISLTDRQIKHFNDAVKKHRGVQIDFSKAAIANMIKSGGIFPLLAAIPALIAAAAPVAAKAAAVGAIGTAAGIATKKILGQGYKKGGLFNPGILNQMIKMFADTAATKNHPDKDIKKREGV